MAVKSKVLSWGKGVDWEGLLESRPRLARALSLLVHGLLGFLGGSVCLFGSCGPFGIALAARSGSGPAGICCVLGAALGYLASGGVERGVRYVAALILVFTASFVFRELAVMSRRWFMPAVAAFVTAVTGALSFFEGPDVLETAVSLVTEVLLAGLCAYFFALALEDGQARNEQEEQRRSAGGALLLCCAVMALGPVTAGRIISLGRLCAAFAVMICAFGGGCAAGAAAGVTLGVAADLAGGGAPLFAMCYGFAGMLAGTLHRRGRLLFTLAFILADAIAVFWSWARLENMGPLYETFIVSVVFLALPARGLAALTGALRADRSGAGEAGLRRYTARRTRELADAFRELYETVRQNAESESNDTDVAAVYDRAAETVCADCPRKGECWHRDYVDTLSVMNDATSAMRARGRLEREDLAARFTDKCPSADAFLEAVNGELRAMTYRRRLRARLEENRTAAYGQYRYLAGVLDAVADDLKNLSAPDALAERRVLRYLNSLDIDAEVSVFRDQSGRLRAVVESARLATLYKTPGYMDKLSSLLGARLCRPTAANRDEGRMVLMEAEPLAVSVGVAAMKKEGEPVSGDRGTYFKTEQGVLCVLLSDGMGSGETAAKESISAVRILERFLRAGVEPATAMKLLNSVMLLRNGENWGYATVDLMCIDLFTGQTGFYKYGAAPSYIRSGRGVRRVKGISLAAGILAGEGETPDVVRMNLKPGGVALIASDGVVSRESDAWLRETLTAYDGGDTRELARQVVREAARQYGCTDDMTVLAVRVEARS